jgi:tRNA(fMet)-specific endonuclease VapC
LYSESFARDFSRGANEKAMSASYECFWNPQRVSVLIVDEETSDRYATIRVALKKAGTPVAANDIWIAASAMQHGLPILTSDRDFQKISQVIVRHFSPV